jgi:hypothetical protein
VVFFVNSSRACIGVSQCNGWVAVHPIAHSSPLAEVLDRVGTDLNGNLCEDCSAVDRRDSSYHNDGSHALLEDRVQLSIII